jgi:hypothetical protein
MMLRITLATVAKEPGHRGEHEGNRKTIAQGMPVETGEPVEDDRILCGHGCIGHPAFPAPLLLGANDWHNSGALRRESAKPCLPIKRYLFEITTLIRHVPARLANPRGLLHLAASACKDDRG